MRSKQNLYTVVGVALSFVIAFGGWALTSELINRKADALLSVTGSVKVPTAPPTGTGEKPGDSDEETDYVWPKLTESEIVAVLQNWEAGGRERPHEPTEGQLSMEQAIDAGRTGLFYFSEQGIIPAELLDNSKINAYLYEYQPSGQGTGLLDPFYSYWTVSFSGESMDVSLTINAVTGQIWKADLSFSGINSNELKGEQVLYVFTSNLELSSADSIKTTGNITSKGFSDGLFYAVVRVESGVKSKITMYLSTRSDDYSDDTPRMIPQE